MRQWTRPSLTPSHYPKHFFLVELIFMNIFQCHDIQILVFSWENVFKNVVCNIAAIFSWPQYVNNEIHVMRLLPFLPTVLIASRWSNRQIIDPDSLATHRNTLCIRGVGWLRSRSLSIDCQVGQSNVHLLHCAHRSAQATVPDFMKITPVSPVDACFTRYYARIDWIFWNEKLRMNALSAIITLLHTL